MPFTDYGYVLGDLLLVRFDADEAAKMGERLAQIDPWQQLDIDAALLTRLFAGHQDCTQRFLVRRKGQPVGAISLRHPFLYGPYIELLAVLPEAQGEGVGRALVDWVADKTLLVGGREVWVAASSFNTAALAFYARQGFVVVGPMPDLVRPGFSETLLRRQLRKSPA